MLEAVIEKFRSVGHPSVGKIHFECTEGAELRYAESSRPKCENIWERTFSGMLAASGNMVLLGSFLETCRSLFMIDDIPCNLGSLSER